MNLRIQPRWPLSPIPRADYANQFSLTFSGGEWLLECGQFLPLGVANRTSEELRAHYEQIEVQVVARLIVTDDGLRALSDLLNRQLGKVGPSVGLASGVGTTKNK